MQLLLAAEAAAPSPVFVNVLAPICVVIIVWLLGRISERMSQKRLFDHRLRLEKEYGLYSDLWEKLFDLQESVGKLVQPFGATPYSPDDEHVLEAFSAYQTAIRKGEPFMRSEVYGPAWQIMMLAQEIIRRRGKQNRIAAGRARGVDTEEARKLEDKEDALLEKNVAAQVQMARLFNQVKEAIRQRVRP
jgi:hypothetical protein